ncbi:hypothetical protein EDC01DRAFT_672659 [Geopyxis carbonaria]|nr:hypothetical protein EDC01DRAFT_672659 [Geopyxis carbonaria]
MILRTLRLPLQRRFNSSAAAASKARLYDPIENAHDFHTALRLSTTANAPLVTLWTASYCPSCRAVAPTVAAALKETAHGVQFAEVRLDAQGGDMGELGLRHMIRSLPTLLAFHRGEAIEELRMTDAKAMGDRRRVDEWLAEVAEKGRAGGSGWFTGLFG